MLERMYVAHGTMAYLVLVNPDVLSKRIQELTERLKISGSVVTRESR
jgi:xanthine/uracil/vitamin C permease (AzgA family)